MSGLDPLDEARAAVERRDWQLALELLAASGSEASSAEGLELRARAAYGSGDFEAAVSAWEDLHSLLVAAGDDIDAARAAAMTAMYLMMDTGLMAPVRGWLRRAERLLEGHGEAPAHAVIAMVRTYERVMCGDIDGARTQSALAIELGGRLGVEPAVVIGRVAAARVKIFDGHVDEGLDLLDEVGVAVDVGRGRRADDGDDVLRVDLRGAGTRTSRPGQRVDRGDGPLAAWCRVRWYQRPMPCPPR